MELKPTNKNILYMLRESNKIEDVHDRYALVNAHRAWKYIMQFNEITPSIIKKTHEKLMVGLPIEPKYRGDFRDVPVSIGGEVKSLPKIVIEALITDLCNDLNNTTNDSVQMHLQFENIHPFIDGNGRMGRIIMNWQRLKKLNSDLLVFTDDNKHEYYMLFPSYRARFRERMMNITKGIL